MCKVCVHSYNKIYGQLSGTSCIGEYLIHGDIEWVGYFLKILMRYKEMGLIPHFFQCISNATHFQKWNQAVGLGCSHPMKEG